MARDDRLPRALHWAMEFDPLGVGATRRFSIVFNCPYLPFLFHAPSNYPAFIRVASQAGFGGLRGDTVDGMAVAFDLDG